MKKACLMILLPFVLSGCAYDTSDKKGEIEEQIRADFDMYQNNDKDHAAYASLSNQLDSEGYYLDAEMDQDPNMIEVSFAESSKLSFEYFYDQNHTKQIDLTKPCFIKRGGSIYAADPQFKNGNNQDYSFSTFVLYSMDSQGNQPVKLPPSSGDDPLVIRLPETRTLQTISVVPIGEYHRKALKLEAYLIRTDGTKKQMNGSWYCNDKLITADSYEIHAPSHYTFKYKYDENQYYVIDSETNKEKSKSGTVTFTDITVDYDTLSVACKAFATGIISDDSGAITDIRVDNQKKKTTEMKLSKLTAGQAITFRTSPEYKIKCDEIDQSEITCIKNSDGYDFTCFVPDNYSELHFYAAKWGNKTIVIDVDSSIIERLYLKAKEFLHKSENDFIKLRIGADEYDYKDLKFKKEVNVNESQEIALIVDSDLSNQESLAYEISINGQTPAYVHKGNQNVPELSFSGTSKISISLKKGFVFSYEYINNGDLQVEYMVDQTILEENQFLPEGTKVDVRVKNADKYTVTGGAVPAGNSFGTIEIKENTNISDFAVQYVAKDGG